MAINRVSARIESKREAVAERQTMGERDTHAAAHLAHQPGTSVFAASERAPLTRLGTIALATRAQPASTLAKPTVREGLWSWLFNTDRKLAAWQKFDPVLALKDPALYPHSSVDHGSSLIKNVAYGVGYLAFPLSGIFAAMKIRQSHPDLHPALAYAAGMASAAARGAKLLAVVAPTHAAFLVMQKFAKRPAR